MKLPMYFLFSLIFLCNYSCRDLCEDKVCLNGGVCAVGHCDCPEGFRGALCEDEFLLLKSVYRDGELDYSYEYNDDKSLSRILIHGSSGGVYRTLIYNYYADSLIINHREVENGIVMDEVIFSDKYFQLGGDTVRVQFFEYWFLMSDYVISSFDPDCGQKQIDIYSAIYTTEYTDENCSSFKDKRSTIDNSFLGSVEITLDDKNRFDESIQIDFLREGSHGNELKVIIANAEGDMRIRQSQYEYNEFDYPISCFVMDVDAGGNEASTNYTYEYY